MKDDIIIKRIPDPPRYGLLDGFNEIKWVSREEFMKMYPRSAVPVNSDQPTLREVLNGWHVVRTGAARIGDKYWRPADRVWLPLIASDGKHGVDVTAKDMPIIIRKERTR